MAKEEAIELEGTVTEVLPDATFRSSSATDMTFTRRSPARCGGFASAFSPATG